MSRGRAGTLLVRAALCTCLCASLGACSTGNPRAPSAAAGAAASASHTAPLAAALAAPPAFKGVLTSGFTGSAWDRFRHRGAAMWACRDIASGDIVSSGMCYGLTQVDRQWPGDAVPPSYRGVPIE